MGTHTQAECFLSGAGFTPSHGLVPEDLGNRGGGESASVLSRP